MHILRAGDESRRLLERAIGRKREPESFEIVGTSTRAAAVDMIVSNWGKAIPAMIDFLNSASAGLFCPIESLFISF